MTLRLLHLSSEVTPFARTGGLGDAVMGLCRALAAGSSEADVTLVTPRYGVTRLPQGLEAERWPQPLRFSLGGRALEVAIDEVRLAPGLRVLLVVHEGYFGGRAGLYGDLHGDFGDNVERFAVLGKAALEASAALWPNGHDLLHAHDWHAACGLLHARIDARFAARPSVLTLHNLAHQGELDAAQLPALGLPMQWYEYTTLEHHGRANLLKAAIAKANHVTAVSPRYAWEITTPEGGKGLDEHLAYHRHKLSGILNGIDAEVWDPAHDAALRHPYDARCVETAKALEKSALCKDLGLSRPHAPLFGLVARFDAQKGIDVLLEVLPALLRSGSQVVMLGSGDAVLEEQVRQMAARFVGSMVAHVGFDERLARRIYAASDVMLVPSRFEPCGLTQMYAMRYGSVPVVSRTGGLVDTVARIDVVHGEGQGYLAEPGEAASLLVACLDALDLLANRQAHLAVQQRLMRLDFSWARSAARFAQLYAELVASAATPSPLR